MIEARCPKCGKSYELEDGVAGKRVRCGKCGMVFEIAAVFDSTPAQSPVTVARTCATCGVDLSSGPRKQDALGHDHCLRCYEAQFGQFAVEAPPPAKPKLPAPAPRKPGNAPSKPAPLDDDSDPGIRFQGEADPARGPRRPASNRTASAGAAPSLPPSPGRDALSKLTRTTPDPSDFVPPEALEEI